MGFYIGERGRRFYRQSKISGFYSEEFGEKIEAILALSLCAGKLEPVIFITEVEDSPPQVNFEIMMSQDLLDSLGSGHQFEMCLTLDMSQSVDSLCFHVKKKVQEYWQRELGKVETRKSLVLAQQAVLDSSVLLFL